MHQAVFTRVGCHGSTHPGMPPAPAPLTVPDDPDGMHRALRPYVGRFLGSKYYDVVIDGTTGRGLVMVGHGVPRTAGEFTLIPLPAPTGDRHDSD